MRKLTNLEYGTVMEAINNAFNCISEDNFIDPYDNEEGITNEQCVEALQTVEKLIQDNQYDKDIRI